MTKIDKKDKEDIIFLPMEELIKDMGLGDFYLCEEKQEFGISIPHVIQKVGMDNLIIYGKCDMKCFRKAIEFKKKWRIIKEIDYLYYN